MTERRRRLIAAAFVLVAVLILIATVVVIGIGLGSTRTTRAVAAAIARIDRALLEENYDLAEATIRETFQDARTAFDWMRLVRRAHEVSLHRQTYDLFMQTAQAAVEDVPGNEDLRALLIHAALLAKEDAVAGEQAARHLQAPRYSALSAEAFLRSGVLPARFARMSSSEPGAEQAEGIPEHDDALLVFLPDSENPLHYEQAAALTGDRRFLVNAVLYSMRRGERDRAYRILERVGPTGYAPYLEFLLSYDAGRYPEALAALTRMAGHEVVRPEVMMIHADILTALDRHAEAAALYHDVRNTNPDFSSLIYLNLHAIEAEEELLQEGLALFAEDRRVLARLISLFHESGRRKQALEAVEFVASVTEHTPELHVYELLLRDMPHERRVALLWELEAEIGPQETAAVALAGHLVAIRDYTGLERLLNRYPHEDFGADLDNFRAVLHLRRERPDEALPHMERAVARAEEGDWISRFNAALIQLETGRAAAAVPLLDEARELLEAAPMRDRRSHRLSEIVYRRALAGAILGDHPRAGQLAREALEFNPDNFDARVLLDNLAVHAP